MIQEIPKHVLYHDPYGLAADITINLEVFLRYIDTGLFEEYPGGVRLIGTPYCIDFDWKYWYHQSLGVESFEKILDYVDDELKIKLLFHLDLF